MTVVHILVALIHAILQIIASALQAGIALALTGILVLVALVGLGVAGVSGLGTLGVLFRRKGRRDDK